MADHNVFVANASLAERGPSRNEIGAGFRRLLMPEMDEAMTSWSHSTSLRSKIPLSFLPSDAIRAVYRWGPHSLVSLLTRNDESLRMNEPVILVRVDDFPRWDLDFQVFMRFDSIMAKHQVPYILGVIPQCEFHRGSPRRLTVDE